MKFKLLIILLIFASLLSDCSMPKESRVMKRKAKIVHESETVLTAAYTSFKGGDYWPVMMINEYLALRVNNLFDFESHGPILSNGYYAGSWYVCQDTIHLTFFNKYKPFYLNGLATINGEEITLYDTDSLHNQTAHGQLKITKNLLNK